jgi:hypothetical protein
MPQNLNCKAVEAVTALINTGHDQHCDDIVYLLFEGANNPVAATESDTIVRLYEDTKTYVGQTVNLQARDSSRRYACHG